MVDAACNMSSFAVIEYAERICKVCQSVKYLNFPCSFQRTSSTAYLTTYTSFIIHLKMYQKGNVLLHHGCYTLRINLVQIVFPINIFKLCDDKFEAFLRNH